MKAEIQALVAAGRTEEALDMLAATANNDAVLLKSRFASGKKQFNMGLMDFGEWQRIQNQVNFALLELVKDGVPSAPPQPPTQPATVSETPKADKPAKPKKEKPKVFISYNHADWEMMQLVRQFLEKKKIEVIVDVQHMAPGEDIQTFIDKSLRDVKFILSIISEDSLRSGWVNIEFGSAQVLKKLTDKVWIPVRIDDACFDNKFFFEANEAFDKKINEQNEFVRKALDSNLDIAPFTAELKRLRDAKNDFGNTIATLKASLVIDISTPPNFEHGLTKVAKQMLAA